MGTIDAPAVALTTGSITPFHDQRNSNIHDLAGRHLQNKRCHARPRGLPFDCAAKSLL
jgi:hypothetical protein